jgi:hypothetical protein
MRPVIARYREYEPCDALKRHIRAFFSFVLQPESRAEHGNLGLRVTREVEFHSGQPFWSTLFADGHASIVFSLGAGYCINGLWHPRPSIASGHVIGPMSSAQTALHGERLVQTGAYFRAASSSVFTGVPASELADRVVAIQDLWSAAASSK